MKRKMQIFKEYFSPLCIVLELGKDLPIMEPSGSFERITDDGEWLWD